MSDEADVEKWSTVPGNACKGPCRDPSCFRDDCLDSMCNRYDLVCEEYTGPLVVMTYDAVDGSHWLRLNGEDMEAINMLPGTSDHSKMCEFVRKRYGNLGIDAVHDHLVRRAKSRMASS